MSITVDWDSEVADTIHVTYHKDWSIHDYYDSSQQMIELMDSVDHKVDFIYEFKETVIPKGALSIFSEMQEKATHSEHPNHGFIMLVGLRGATDQLFQLYSRLFMDSERFARARSVPDARAALEGRRAQ